MKWEKSQANRVCDECFEGDLPAMDEHAERYLKDGHSAVRDLGESFRAIVLKQNREEWWKRAKKLIDNELQRINEEISKQMTGEAKPENNRRGLIGKQFDGFVILEEAILSLKIDLTALVAATGLWANPEVHEILVRDYGSGAWHPRTRRFKKGEGEKGDTVEGIKLDDNTYANDAIKKALGIKDKEKNFNTCHIWDDSCHDEFDHTTIANLVLLPAPLSTLADHHQGVKDALKYRAYELYAWHPKKEDIPVKPKSYPLINWREPLPITDQIKKSIKKRRQR